MGVIFVYNAFYQFNTFNFFVSFDFWEKFKKQAAVINPDLIISILMDHINHIVNRVGIIKHGMGKRFCFLIKNLNTLF